MPTVLCLIHRHRGGAAGIEHRIRGIGGPGTIGVPWGTNVIEFRSRDRDRPEKQTGEGASLMRERCTDSLSFFFVMLAYKITWVSFHQ